MLKIVKDSVLKVTRSFGYDIVPLRYMKERDFSLHLRELLMRLDVDCMLDVGANAGQYPDFLRDRALYDGPIVSFEPLSRHVAGLRVRSESNAEINTPCDSERVTVRTLDLVMQILQERIGFRRPYLKIDTQGNRSARIASPRAAASTNGA